jgi:hypothetical protein
MRLSPLPISTTVHVLLWLMLSPEWMLIFSTLGLLYSLQAKAVPPTAVRPRVTNMTRLNIGAGSFLN